jgi:FMN phosphatase YigB (HAD superfamily)
MTFTKKIFLRAAAAVLMLFQAPLLPKVIVWDLGYVCFAPTKFKMAWSIGLPSLIYHKLTGGGDVKQKMFDFLTDTFGKQIPHDPHNHDYVMGDGLVLPKIYCEHMKGNCSGAELLEKSRQPLRTYFSSKSERKLIRRLMKHVFDPKTFAQYMCPIDETAQLLEKIATTTDTTCMVLSNFATDAFEAIYAKEESQAIFKHIPQENIIVSGYVGMLKPHANIYEYLKTKLIEKDSRFANPAYLAKECIFIDDQIENIIAARKAGIAAYHFDGDHQKLSAALILDGFLTTTQAPLRSKL